MIVPLVVKQLENFQTSAFEKIFTLLLKYDVKDTPNSLEDTIKNL